MCFFKNWMWCLIWKKRLCVEVEDNDVVEEKKESVLLINLNRKKFLTVNSFDNKKVKRKTNSFFFVQKTLQNSLSNTLFNLSFSSKEEKQNKKPVAALFFSGWKKNTKKSTFFFDNWFFFVFFSTVEIIFSMVEILIDFFLSMVEIFNIFFNHWSYFFDGWVGACSLVVNLTMSNLEEASSNPSFSILWKIFLVL